MPDRAAGSKTAACAGSIGRQELFLANMLCAAELGDGRNERSLRFRSATGERIPNHKIADVPKWNPAPAPVSTLKLLQPSPIAGHAAQHNRGC